MLKKKIVDQYVKKHAKDPFVKEKIEDYQKFLKKLEQEKQAASPAEKVAPTIAPAKKTSPTKQKKTTSTKSEKKAIPSAPVKKSASTKPSKKTTPTAQKKAVPVIQSTKTAPPVTPIKIPSSTLPRKEMNQPQKKETLDGKKCNDLIMILDPKMNERIDGKCPSLSFVLLVALQEKAAPIIITSNIVENFCVWKSEHKELLNEVKKEIFLTNNEALSQKKAFKLAEQQSIPFVSFSDERRSLAIMSSLLSLTDLTGNDWHCYAHKTANFMLLIPKNYVANRVQKSISDTKSQIKECGFDITNLDKIDNASHEAVLKYIQAKNTKQPNKFDGTALESMFIKIEKSPTSITDPATWNIYLTGHGGPAAKKKNIKEELAKYEESLTKGKATLNALEANFELFVQKGLGHLKTSLILEIENLNKNIQQQSTLLKSAETLSDEAVVSQTATVAGLDFNDFSRLMKFFNSGIQTSFLHYMTCFAGGYNQAFVSEMLSQLKSNCIVSTQGINEQSVSTKFPRLKRNENGPGLILSQMQFTPFFEMLENFFGNPTKFVSTRGKQESWQQDPIAAIVRNVVDVTDIQQNQPFVRVPSVGIFNALTVDKTVKILTNSITRAHELEGRAINFTDPNIKNILVYPTTIGVLLKIGRSVYFISPTPANITPNINTVHIFEEIVADDQLTNIIGNFASLNASYSKIIFVIKKLQCLDYNNSGLAIGTGKPITIENMTIEITGDRAPIGGQIDANIKIRLVCNDKTYTLSKDVKNLSVQTVASTLLSQPLLASTDISSDMQRQFVNDLENKIDTTFAVQKPGALKKVLLLKTLDGLERAVDPEQLEQEKAWLEKNNKPATVFINKLTRYKDDLAKLKEQIDELSAGEMNSQERDTAQKRIANVQAKITEAIPT